MPRKGPPALAVDGEAAGFGGVGGGGANGNEGAPAFGITESGTFCKDDWRVKSTGIQQTPAGTGPVSTLRMADLQVEGTALASGASGSVRRAVHTPSGRMMAIKAIDVRDKSKCDQMMTEVKTLFNAQSGGICPNLVEFYDAFWEDPFMYLAMEYMDCGSLDVPFKRCAQPTEEVASVVVRQVMLGLNFLHRERHNIHRDLKPGNVLINSAGQVKLADFGISRSMDNTLAQANTMTGTTIYMSPERMQGKAYSFGADVWSLGIITTECVIGRYPYNIREGGKYFDLVMMIVAQPAPQPGEAFSPEINDFVMHATHKEEAKRASCQELLTHAFVQKYAASSEACVAAWLQSSR